jgi:hypothetical protein
MHGDDHVSLTVTFFSFVWYSQNIVIFVLYGIICFG